MRRFLLDDEVLNIKKKKKCLERHATAVMEKCAFTVEYYSRRCSSQPAAVAGRIHACRSDTFKKYVNNFIVYSY